MPRSALMAVRQAGSALAGYRTISKDSGLIAKKIPHRDLIIPRLRFDTTIQIGETLKHSAIVDLKSQRPMRRGFGASWPSPAIGSTSNGGKERRGGITKQGNRYLHRLLFAGALAVIRCAERHDTRRPWLAK